MRLWGGIDGIDCIACILVWFHMKGIWFHFEHGTGSPNDILGEYLSPNSPLVQWDMVRLDSSLPPPFSFLEVLPQLPPCCMYISPCLIDYLPHLKHLLCVVGENVEEKGMDEAWFRQGGWSGRKGKKGGGERV
jgi:hypothetical protein